MSSGVPEGWGISKIGDAITSAEGGVSVNSENRPKTLNEIGVLKTSSVYEGQFIPMEHKAILSSEIHKVTISPKQDHILFSRMNTPSLVGQSAYIKADHPELFLPDRLWQLKIKQNYNAKWLSYLLRSQKVVKQISDAATGTSNSMKNIAKSNLMAIQALFPPLSEQKKIAAILSSMDAVIEKTQAQIDKLKDLKTGMMQELLSKGIGHTSFKCSSVGLIPYEWSVSPLSEVFNLISGSTPPRKKKEYFFSCPDSIPWVKTMDLNDEVIFTTNEKITSEAIKNTSCKLLPIGTTLIAMYGGWNQIGRTSILGIPATTNQAICALVCKELVSGSFANYWMIYKRPFWKSIAASSRKDPNITKSDIANFLIAIPSVSEQSRIVDRLDSLTDLINIKKTRLTYHIQVKKALMQDLLSGKVRVKVDAA